MKTPKLKAGDTVYERMTLDNAPDTIAERTVTRACGVYFYVDAYEHRFGHGLLECVEELWQFRFYRTRKGAQADIDKDRQLAKGRHAFHRGVVNCLTGSQLARIEKILDEE